jgi:flagellar biosynthesis protein FlhF
MSAKRFYASRAREALEMVRNEFGPDANIISNKMVNGWNEIIATRGTSSEATSNPADEPSLASKEEIPPRSFASSSRSMNERKTSASTSLSLDDVMTEIIKMKRTFESQISEISWATPANQSPLKQTVIKAMLNAGFGVSVSRRLVDRMPNDYSAEQAMAWAQQILSKNICLAESEQELFERGGVMALIGPTGVGKTTTIAKIAARFVQSRGAEQLALITTDAYRVGGYEQLKIFGKILGVIVHCVKDQDELNIALREFKHKHLVLIDTAGMSQRDRMAADQMQMISNAQTKIRKILCLNATSSLDTLEDVVKRFSL